ncbi:MAG: sulfite exporter TauE/SafE family protein [Bacillota bacterium]
MIDPLANTLAIFFIGLYAGILRVCYGTAAQLLAVPLLNIFGLPPVFAAGTVIAGNFCQTAATLVQKGSLSYAHRRLGLALGIFGIIGMFLGHALLAGISGVNQNIFTATCAVFLLAAGAATLAYSLGKEKNSGPGQNPFPSGWPFLFRPGPGSTRFIEFLSLPAVFLAGLGIGFGTGFWGLGAGLLGIILLTGVLHAPPQVAAATDLIASSLIGAAALLTYLFAGHLVIGPFLLFLTGLFFGYWAGHLAPPEIKAGLFRPAFGGLLLLGAATTALKIAGHAKIAGLLALGGMILLCALLLAGHFLISLRSPRSFPGGTAENRPYIRSLPREREIS